MRVVPAVLGLVVVAAAAVAGSGPVLGPPVVTQSQVAPAAVKPSPIRTMSPAEARAVAKAAAKEQARMAAATRRATLEQNQLYSAGRIPRVRCALPGGSLATKAALHRYLATAATCMTRAWQPMITQQNAGFVPPKVLLFDRKDKPRSACGKPPDSPAFYCSWDNTILFETREWLEEPDYDREHLRVGLLSVMAHEYGHHVQDQVAIFTYLDEVRALRKGKQWQVAVTERSELQASCLGAAFLGANERGLRLTGARLEAWEDYSFEGDKTHGTDANNEYWTSRAFASGDPKSCNTWSAPAKRVS